MYTVVNAGKSCKNVDSFVLLCPDCRQAINLLIETRAQIGVPTTNKSYHIWSSQCDTGLMNNSAATHTAMATVGYPTAKYLFTYNYISSVLLQAVVNIQLMFMDCYSAGLEISMMQEFPINFRHWLFLKLQFVRIISGDAQTVETHHVSFLLWPSEARVLYTSTGHKTIVYQSSLRKDHVYDLWVTDESVVVMEINAVTERVNIPQSSDTPSTTPWAKTWNIHGYSWTLMERIYDSSTRCTLKAPQPRTKKISLNRQRPANYQLQISAQ